MFIGDTATSVNQGGASGSTGVQEGGKQMRMAAAEARRVLVEMAADKLGIPADQLTVTDGVVHAASDAAKKVSYAELIGGQLLQRPSRLERQIRQSALRAGQGAAEGSEGSHDRRAADSARRHRAEGFCASRISATDVKVPGMVHGRMIRPAVAGAVPVKVDESSIKDIPTAKVVWDKGFLGVVADKEWDAIKAAQQLKVEWSEATPPFPDQAALYDHIRKAPARKREVAASRPAMSTTRSSRRRA